VALPRATRGQEADLAGPSSTAEEAEIFRNVNINYFSCTAAYNQEGARLALESPLSEEAIRRMVDIFQERERSRGGWTQFCEGIRCQRPKGAFYAFPNVANACNNLGILDAYQSLPADTRKRTSPSTLLQMFLLYEYQVARWTESRSAVLERRIYITCVSPLRPTQNL